MSKTAEKLRVYQGFYTPHSRASDYTGELVDPKTGEFYTPPSMTKQSFIAECDINNIMKQYKLSGVVSHINAQAELGRYEHLPDPVDFQDAQNAVITAQSAFASLPSTVRNRFSNNPAEFLEFMADPKNRDEAIKLGLAKDTTPPAPPKAPDVPPPRDDAPKAEK